MLKINGQIYPNINLIPCKCGLVSNYQIWKDDKTGDELIALFCDACGRKESPAKLEKYIPNPDAPWHQI